MACIDLGVLGTVCIDQGCARYCLYRLGVYIIDLGCVRHGLYIHGVYQTQRVYIWAVLVYTRGVCIGQRCSWHDLHRPGVCPVRPV